LIALLQKEENTHKTLFFSPFCFIFSKRKSKRINKQPKTQNTQNYFHLYVMSHQNTFLNKTKGTLQKALTNKVNVSRGTTRYADIKIDKIKWGPGKYIAS